MLSLALALSGTLRVFCREGFPGEAAKPKWLTSVSLDSPLGIWDLGLGSKVWATQLPC